MKASSQRYWTRLIVARDMQYLAMLRRDPFFTADTVARARLRIEGKLSLAAAVELMTMTRSSALRRRLERICMAPVRRAARADSQRVARGVAMARAA